MLISVVIPTVRPAHLGDAIESICKQTYSDWELIVVSQGNRPDLKAFVAKGHPDSRVRFLHLEECGLSLARNAGIEDAHSDIIAFIDDDCEAQNDWLAVLTKRFAENPEVGLIGGSLVPPNLKYKGLKTCPGIIPSESIYDPAVTPFQAPAGWDWVGGNFALRRHIYDEIGPFDTFMGPGSATGGPEDADYKLRMELAQIKTMATPKSVVNHTYGTRIGFRAVLKNSESYARMNGVMAAKLTLMGDRRGKEWVDITRRQCTIDPISKLRLHRLLFSLNRWRVFYSAYRDCLRDYRVNDRNLLEPRNQG